MLTNVRGYVEVWHAESAGRRGTDDDDAMEQISHAFRVATGDPYPDGQLATYLSHHADLVQQLAGVLPHRVAAAPAGAPAAPAHGGAGAAEPVAVAARVRAASLGRTFNVALRSLYELHDLTIPRAARTAASGGGATKPPQQALLALSQLHAQYGHTGRALEALMEAVDVDQGSGDGESLVMCLLQLCAILRAAPPEATAHAHGPDAHMQVRSHCCVPRCMCVSGLLVCRPCFCNAKR